MARKSKHNPHAESIRRRKMQSRKRREESAVEEAPAPLTGEVRLNRFIAQTGLGSRRTADGWIAEGRVSVNGKPVTELGSKVDADKDHVELDGRAIKPQPFTYVLLNKPRNTITTTDDPRDRRTVVDLLPPEIKRIGVVPVGRLDRDTTGVLLLTNDGELAHRLMHPSYEVEKIYRVETERAVSRAELDQLLNGVDLDDGSAKADMVSYLDKPTKIALSIHEGRNRQVRRMFEALGHTVVRLERSHQSGMTTAGLRPGKFRLLESHEIDRLRRSVKLKPLVL